MINPNLCRCIENIQLTVEDLGNKITSSQMPNLKALEFQIGELFTAVSQSGNASPDEHHENLSISLNLLSEKLENLECLLMERCERRADKSGFF